MAQHNFMEPIYADIELINVIEMLNAKRGFCDEKSVGKMRLKAIVNSGAWMTAINENIQEQLRLEFIKKGRRKCQAVL